MGFFNALFGNKEQRIKDLKHRGAIIIDVRTRAEYGEGAIEGSKNIPLQILSTKVDDIKKLNKPIITCCASGMRSARAASILKHHGIESFNGGGWMALKHML
ncbi:rhodanese-like domain-containing protein [Aestuariivivens sediminis]|uniref:rhodanese-like domain-containing protein n=1 Tax=Aestuariivivens sediminis TaxID=2913557 RepID=UPI001F59D8BD|nr:rhodanese-like domain-containing protein [Aestuariivivens sediminis]